MEKYLNNANNQLLSDNFYQNSHVTKIVQALLGTVIVWFDTRYKLALA